MKTFKAVLVSVLLLTLCSLSWSQSGSTSSASTFALFLSSASQVYMGTIPAGVVDTSDVIVIPAAANLYNYPTILTFNNTSSTSTWGYVCNGTCAVAANRVDIFIAPPGGSYKNVIPFRSSVNTNVCIAAASGVTTLYACARGYRAAH